MPKEVGKEINCQSNKLTNLLHCPSIVNGFNCCYNQLTTLEGGPKEVSGSFYCYSNQLTTLKGGPLKVTSYYNCSDNKLTSLIGCPDYIGGTFNFSDNNGITNLDSFPISVGGIDFMNVPLILSNSLFKKLRAVVNIQATSFILAKLKAQIPIQFGITDQAIIDEIWQSYTDILQGKSE